MKLVNNYLHIEPVEHVSFMQGANQYDEVGKVLAVPEGVEIPLGSKVYFDSFMAKKFPSQEDPQKFNWFVHLGEVVAYE